MASAQCPGVCLLCVVTSAEGALGALRHGWVLVGSSGSSGGFVSPLVPVSLQQEDAQHRQSTGAGCGRQPMGLCTQLCSLPLSCTYSCLSSGFPTAMCPVPGQSGAPRLPNGLGCTTMRCSLPALLGSLYLSPCWPDMSHACGVRTLLSDCEQVRTALCIAGVVLQPLAPAPGLCWGGSSGTARGGLSADAGSSTAELYMGHGEPCRGICSVPFAVAPLAGDWRASTGEAVSVLRELQPAQFLLPFTCRCPSAGLSPHPDVRCCHLSCIA